MPITYPAVVHKWTNADGTPGYGEIEFKLSTAITNGDVTITPSKVVVQLDDNGSISQRLASNLDDGTVPTTSYWFVIERLEGSDTREWVAQVPSASATGMPIELGALVPFVTQQAFG